MPAKSTNSIPTTLYQSSEPSSAVSTAEVTSLVGAALLTILRFIFDSRRPPSLHFLLTLSTTDANRQGVGKQALCGRSVCSMAAAGAHPSSLSSRRGRWGGVARAGKSLGEWQLRREILHVTVPNLREGARDRHGATSLTVSAAGTRLRDPGTNSREWDSQFGRRGRNGGREGIRTLDLSVANAALSQLSYAP